jgi:cytochrome c peroxidase
MSCHSQVWTNSPLLEPIRQSYLNGTPVQWNKVYDLPDFVYFNHSIHVQKGIGCNTCHGPIHEMNITYKAQPLSMSWCLDCHRQPEKYIRPREEVFNVNYQPPANQMELGAKLVKEYNIQKGQLTNCSICHR